MHLPDRLDKKQLTSAFITAGDINPTPKQLKQYYPIWWANVRKDGGLRLTDEGFKFVINHLKLVSWSYKLDRDNIKSQTLLDLDKHIDCPYWISKSKTKLVLFGEETAVLMNLYGGDIHLYLSSTKAWN